MPPLRAPMRTCTSFAHQVEALVTDLTTTLATAAQQGTLIANTNVDATSIVVGDGEGALTLL